ncbi:hypothetical protein HRbin01_00289 [archaeon HR01]|nr:hypothetical protein HRbin01_00289 [archaeon HR01]
MDPDRGRKNDGDKISDLFKVLNHPVRREIIKLLHERIDLSYTELLSELKIDEGQFNFHLRTMKELVNRMEDGRYKLSQLGEAAYHIISDAVRSLGAVDHLAKPSMGWRIVLRRVAAFILDVSIFMIATGAFLDENIWHLAQLHMTDISRHMTEIISAYAHIFFAAFIIFTLLEAYKGQTLGKYVMGIRATTITGRRLTIVESGIRNAGKVFLLPIDLLVGIIFLRGRGYLRFFDYYTRSMVSLVEDSR